MKIVLKMGQPFLMEKKLVFTIRVVISITLDGIFFPKNRFDTFTRLILLLILYIIDTFQKLFFFFETKLFMP